MLEIMTGMAHLIIQNKLKHAEFEAELDLESANQEERQKQLDNV
jgi:hypothetical protein